MSKGGFMKDAMILFAITLVSGACLGGVYEITKAPIAAAEMAAKAEAYKTVLPEAETFEEAGSADALAAANTEISGLGYGNVTVDEAVSGKDAPVQRWDMLLPLPPRTDMAAHLPFL